MALDLKTGRQLWQKEPFGARVLFEDVVFVLWYETLVAYEQRTGTELWRRDLRGDLGKHIRGRFAGFSTFLAASRSHIFVGDMRGRLWVLDVSTGEPVWSHLPPGATGYSGAQPLVAEGRLYMSGFTMSLEAPPSLYCYELQPEDRAR